MYKVTSSCVRTTVVAVEKAIIITRDVCVSVALVIQHVLRVRRIVTCGLPGSGMFFHTSQKRHGFIRETLLNLKCVF